MAHRNSHIQNNLKKYRRIMGFSKKEVARRLGFKNTNRINRWEKGKSMPSSKNLLKLSILYATLPNELYFDLCQTLKSSVRKEPQ